MDRLMEKILSLELLEKIIRMELFLERASLESQEPDLRVINVYKSVVESIKKSLQYPLRKFRDDYGDMEEYEYRSCMKRLMDAFNSLDLVVHAHLSFIHGDWTLPETYTFIKGLFRPEDEISIVLSDTYMFEEANLSEFFESQLYIPYKGGDERKTTLFLPKIEVMNPLNWTILVHEMGHTMKKPLEDIFTHTEIGEMLVSDEGRRILDSWTEEICSDLISLKILGPAYLSSFITFVLLLGSQPGLENITTSHPDPRFRINIMKDVLEKNSIDLPFAQESLFQEYGDIVNFYDHIFEERCRFEQRYMIDEVKEEPMFPLVYQRFRDLIYEKVEEITPEEICYSDIEKDKTHNLVGMIKDKIPISSYREIDQKKVIDTLDKVEKDLDSIAKKDAISKKMKRILAMMKEEPNSFSEIINAGWLYKCEIVYPKMTQVFFVDPIDSPKAFSDAVEEYKKEIVKLDELLRKSIETAHIHGIFGKR